MKTKLNFTLSATILFLLFLTTSVFAQKDRSKVEDKYKWDLTHLYASDVEWQKSKDALVAELDKIGDYRGTLTKSSSNLLKCLEFSSNIKLKASKLYIYSNMKSDLDLRDMKYSSMKKELQQIFSNYSAKAAFITPEILTAEWEVIEKFIKTEPGLKVYEKGLTDMFLKKKHILSEKEERIMALSGSITRTPQSIFSTFSNAEMPYPEVTLSTGETVTLDNATFSKLRASENRDDRHLVFETFWNNFSLFKASYGEMIYGNVKSDIFNYKARNYSSSLEAAIKPNDIPVEVYHSLIENVNKNLPAFHRYLEIKKRMLGVDTLKYLDLYAPVVKDINLKYDYDETKKIVLESLKPLGKEYVSTVNNAFENRWIDVYPGKGKRSGAYSNGAAYDKHPYILLNYNGLYNDVSTLSHELGHTMHSYFSNKTQPYPTSDYVTFVAEVASTFNEVLLFNHIMKTVKDDDVKLSILMNWLDGFKGTLFRQTQFAEFELQMHEAAEKGIPLTGESLSEMYEALVKKYYGHDKGICHIDDYISLEWAYVPHFYYNFYVYQYSTSFTASISLAERVMNEDDGALEKYMAFISSGGSDYPIELLKKAGVDMTTSTPFDKTIEAMNAVMDQIEKILDKKKK